MSEFRWDAGDYSRNASAQQAWGQELLAHLELGGREQILDLGCGDGSLSARLAAMVPQGGVVGLDLSPEMIAFARESHPPETYPNLEFEVGDAARLEYEERFDRVFSNAALHWIIDQASLLAGIKRALRPGGRMVVQMGGQGNCQGIFLVRDQLMASPRWREYFTGMSVAYRFPGDGEYAQLLREAGLTPLRVELIPRDMTHQGREGLKGWIRTTWLPYLERLPQDRREEFIFSLVDAYLEGHPLDPAGRTHVEMVRLEAVAQA